MGSRHDSSFIAGVTVDPGDDRPREGEYRNQAGLKGKIGTTDIGS